MRTIFCLVDDPTCVFPNTTIATVEAVVVADDEPLSFPDTVILTAVGKVADTIGNYAFRGRLVAAEVQQAPIGLKSEIEQAVEQYAQCSVDQLKLMFVDSIEFLKRPE